MRDRRFALFLRPLSRLGGPNDAKLPVLELSAALKIARDFSLDCEDAGVPSRVMTPVEESAVCYASRLNSWVVRSDGRLAKCTVAFESDSNNVGRILSDGSFSLDPEKIKPWIRGLDSRNPAELGCPLQNFPSLSELAGLKPRKD